MNRKDIVNESGEKIGEVDGSVAYDASGYVYGSVAYFGGDIGYVSFAGTRVGGQTTGQLVPQDNGTMLLTD